MGIISQYVKNPLQRVKNFMNPVSPYATPGDGARIPPEVTRQDRSRPIEDVMLTRWEEPPPGHLEAMIEATVNVQFFRGHHFAKRTRILNKTGNAVRLPAKGTTPKVIVNILNRIIRDLISLRCKAVPNLLSLIHI